jgi:hypothetical protein
LISPKRISDYGDKIVCKQCISKGSKIWIWVFLKLIFDLQLHGILAIKGSAGETEAPEKAEILQE